MEVGASSEWELLRVVGSRMSELSVENDVKVSRTSTRFRLSNRVWMSAIEWANGFVCRGCLENALARRAESLAGLANLYYTKVLKNKFPICRDRIESVVELIWAIVIGEP